MGKIYSWRNNPFQDYLFVSLLFNNDITSEEVESDIYVGINTILEHIIYDKQNLIYLDYEIIEKNDYIRVVGKNIVTALWLSGIFPRNPDKVMDDNKFVINDRKYTFNNRSKKLNYRLLKK